jgi:hypothetical protein
MYTARSRYVRLSLAIAVTKLTIVPVGVIQSVVTTGEAARLFEPVRPASDKRGGV